MLFALVLTPFASALLLALLGARAARHAAWLAGAAALTCTAILVGTGPEVFAGTVLRAGVPWFQGVDFGFRMDGLAFAFALLIGAIGALVVLYAAYYLAPTDSPARFFASLLAFMGAMFGVVLADNLVLLVVFWELTSVASFLLIGFWTHRADARQGARMALTITGAGGLCLLAGVLLIGEMAGGYDLDRVLAAGDAIRAHRWYVPALVLVLLGAFTKSAQFPFHFWLPHAMAAPTPVSAYLHSATMVKAGVFLLARLYPALGMSEPWFHIVTSVGLATLLLGAAVAIFQHDFKGLLAYSTVSHLGLITLLFGLDSPLAVVAAVFHILNHAAFKASLFMAAGIIDHETGSRDMRQLNGLWQTMPITGTLAIVACSAMAGVPLLNGFLSKEMFFAETLAVQSNGVIEWVVPAVATLGALLSVAYSVRFVHDVFFNGQPVGLTKTPHEPPRWMRVPVEALVVVCLLVGMLPALTVGPLLAVAARAALGGTLPEYSLAIWHGFNAPLLMSMMATLGGVALYFTLHRTLDLHTVSRLPVDGRRIFDAVLGGLQRTADRLLGMLPFGSLPRMLRWLLVAALVAGVAPFVAGLRNLSLPTAVPEVAVGADAVTFGVALVVWILGVSSAVAAGIRYRQRLTALILIGVTGLMVSLAFVLLSAPDLALTQLLVETVTIVLIMLVLRFLPPSAPAETAVARQWRDAGIAAISGLGVAVVAWAVLVRPFDSISPFYLAQALSAGGGSNVVNVIIVDFRGFDTLGEISVLGVAALIVHALLAQYRAPASFTPAAGAPDWNPLLLKTVARMLLPLAALVAVHLFLRGHNLPGGGFVAGLVLASAIVVLRIAGGADMSESHDGRHVCLIAAGLLIAGATGAASGWLGHPFLTSTYAHPEVPLLGDIPLASAALFDLGVFLCVVGATLLALLAPRQVAPSTTDTSAGRAR